MAPPSVRTDVLYAARRIAWHVLDHAWEIEDRSDQEAVIPVDGGGRG